MGRSYTHIVLAWGLIAAQLCVVVFGHGRVLICHESTGETHVELVGQDTCLSNEGDSCSPTVSFIGGLDKSMYSETACVDELFELACALRMTRGISSRSFSGVEPSHRRVLKPLSMTLVNIAYQSHTVVGLFGRKADWRSLRATVLVL